LIISEITFIRSSCFSLAIPQLTLTRPPDFMPLDKVQDMLNKGSILWLCRKQRQRKQVMCVTRATEFWFDF
jgi:hypothetical protein